VSVIAKRFRASWKQLFEPDVEDYCWEVSQCCTTNARPHNAAHTVESLRQLNFEVLKHPLHCPGLAPSDYGLFGLLIGAFWGAAISPVTKVKKAENAWLVTQPKPRFSKDPKKLVDCWTKCWKGWGLHRKNIFLHEGKVVPVLDWLSTTPWRRMGERMYRSTFSWPRH
jgi:hypothetical protein